jgi:hypothetical protein
LIFLVNKNKRVAIGTISFIAGGYLLETYLEVPILSFFKQAFDLLYTQPLGLGIPLAVFILMWYLTEKFLKAQLYLDKGLSKKKERIIGSKLHFLDAWGPTGVLLKNDIRLIIRNIRARQVVMMVFVFVLWIVFFYTGHL